MTYSGIISANFGNNRKKEMPERIIGSEWVSEWVSDVDNTTVLFDMRSMISGSLVHCTLGVYTVQMYQLSICTSGNDPHYC